MLQQTLQHTILATLTGWPAVDRQLGKLHEKGDEDTKSRVLSAGP